ncbi:MAG: type II secretion system F family protein [Candidatus Omnitrophota bacterium]|jgi:MSHA biogenesis protein MshG|nr:MAG: type II secretion system F family protein [Candidatus Omnitrophota bacterium]
MPVFHYRASNAQGTVIEGKEFAENMDQILQLLADRNLHPIQVLSPDAQRRIPTIEELLSRKLPVSRRQIAIFFDQLAMMLNSGISIVDALKSLEEQRISLRLKEALVKIRENVEQGVPLHLAMRECGDLFDEASIRVVESGEQSGQLDVSLVRLTEMIEFDLEIRKKFKEATRYPKIVIGTLVLAVGILITAVIPRFSNLFDRANIDLPILTKILLNSHTLFIGNWAVLVAFLILLYVLKHLIQRDKKLSVEYDRWKTKIPFVGGLNIKIEMSRIFKIQAMLIESGVDILTALKLAAGIAQNRLVAAAFLQVREKLEEGNSLASSLDSIPLFPSMARRMIILGEKTGRLSESLTKVSNMYERQTTATIKQISGLIEPMLIIVIGCVIIMFALGIFLPMWDLVKVIR